MLTYFQVWLAIAAVLSAFVIEKEKDSSGKEVPLTAQYTDGVIRRVAMKLTITRQR